VPDTQLRRQQQKAVDDWFAAKIRGQVCPGCGGSAWVKGQPLAALGVQGTTPTVNVLYPTLPIFCADCSPMRLYRLDVLHAQLGVPDQP
jgi:hypothetical protein